MNRLNIPDPSNGIKIFWETFEYMLGSGAFDGTDNNGGIIKFLEDLCVEIGTDNFIVTGCNGTTPVTEGWVFLDGELLKVPEHNATDTHFVKSTVNPIEGGRIDPAGNSIDIYDQYIAKVTAGSGSLALSGATRLDDVIGSFVDDKVSTLKTTTITDCDDADKTGFFIGNGAANMPPGTSGEFMLIAMNNIGDTPYHIIHTGSGVYYRFFDSVFNPPGYTNWRPISVDSDPQTQFIGATPGDDISLGTGITIAIPPTDTVIGNYVSIDNKGNVELSLQVTRDNDTRYSICTLPAAFRPSYQVVMNTYIYGGGAGQGTITVNTNGTVVISTGDTFLSIAAKVRYSV